MDGYALTMANIQWGSIVLFHIRNEPIYYIWRTTNAGMHDQSTATSSYEFKKHIQPIMDGHVPTMFSGL